MRVPPDLLAAVEEETSRFDRGQLARAAAALTELYRREHHVSSIIASDLQRAAYLAVRLPATYAAASHVLREMQRRAPQLEITSLLDLGAGPGTALLAAKELFPALARATLLDADPGWQKFGRRVAELAGAETSWLQHDLRINADLEPHDLVMICYALGELPEPARDSLMRGAWQSARHLLVIVEPGTVRGFAAVNAARSWLLANGANLVAPCPHQFACPMTANGGVHGARDFGAPGQVDWCHFAQRVERSSLHRSLKGGALGHEDEKFSYLVAAHHAAALPAARIVRHPQRHGGHVQLTLCTAQGLTRATITKSQKQAYKQARQADWGDAWSDPSYE
jgi:ribosomal protein RSM22 (predicted rRNA methylase)